MKVYITKSRQAELHKLYGVTRKEGEQQDFSVVEEKHITDYKTKKNTGDLK